MREYVREPTYLVFMILDITKRVRPESSVLMQYFVLSTMLTRDRVNCERVISPSVCVPARRGVSQLVSDKIIFTSKSGVNKGTDQLGQENLRSH